MSDQTETLYTYTISTGDYAGDLERPWMTDEMRGKLGSITLQAPSLQEAMARVTKFCKFPHQQGEQRVEGVING